MATDNVVEIKSNTCPYCGGPYTLDAGGCVSRCADMLRHAELVEGATDPGEQAETQLLEWDDLWSAMQAHPHTKEYPWVPTTEHMYQEMLEVLPPAAMGRGGFLVGEPETHNEHGEAVYACFVQIGDRFQARYMTRREFADWRQVRL